MSKAQHGRHSCDPRGPDGATSVSSASRPTRNRVHVLSSVLGGQSGSSESKPVVASWWIRVASLTEERAADIAVTSAIFTREAMEGTIPHVRGVTQLNTQDHASARVRPATAYGASRPGWSLEGEPHPGRMPRSASAGYRCDRASFPIEAPAPRAPIVMRARAHIGTPPGIDEPSPAGTAVGTVAFAGTDTTTTTGFLAGFFAGLAGLATVTTVAGCGAATGTAAAAGERTSGVAGAGAGVSASVGNTVLQLSIVHGSPPVVGLFGAVGGIDGSEQPPSLLGT